ncbi:MAG: hypothetical protein U0694_19065 [Anaerolineae bacterium]
MNSDSKRTGGFSVVTSKVSLFECKKRYVIAVELALSLPQIGVDNERLWYNVPKRLPYDEVMTVLVTLKNQWFDHLQIAQDRLNRQVTMKEITRKSENTLEPPSRQERQGRAFRADAESTEEL